MFHLKLNKTLYYLTLLVGLVSFSGLANTIPFERTTIELVLTTTSEYQKAYDYKNGFIKNPQNQIRQFYLHDFSSFLYCKHNLEALVYANFKEKHLPYQNTLPILKYQYHSSFMDIESVV